jgi:hypothetical protein
MMARGLYALSPAPKYEPIGVLGLTHFLVGEPHGARCLISDVVAPMPQFPLDIELNAIQGLAHEDVPRYFMDFVMYHLVLNLAIPIEQPLH